ncbi:MAG: tetratricopeptide repeat protein [Chloroflexi bacterium]|nr:tetratricopeptide repeat protein [Chloroflexota bacterium]MCC6895621.1 tetratricopeptide repeat protein [Anaerolineae bacterium]
MGKITAYLFSRFRAWERSTQVAFILALILLLVSFGVFSTSSETLRQNALIGVVGLIFALQVIFMWGNRTMVTAFTQAQRRYLAGDFAGTRQILEQFHDTGKANMSSLTLLANTYRQLGDLEKSEEIVKKALALRPFDHFPLYSFGRTLLIRGLYTQAVEVIQQAIDADAPTIVYFDLGEALYRAGNMEAAAAALQRAQHEDQEPFRLLMTVYLLYRMQLGDAPPGQLVNAGIAYWAELASRFQNTPYGQTLADDVAYLQAYVEET